MEMSVVSSSVGLDLTSQRKLSSKALKLQNQNKEEKKVTSKNSYDRQESFNESEDLNR